MHREAGDVDSDTMRTSNTGMHTTNREKVCVCVWVREREKETIDGAQKIWVCVRVCLWIEWQFFSKKNIIKLAIFDWMNLNTFVYHQWKEKSPSYWKWCRDPYLFINICTNQTQSAIKALSMSSIIYDVVLIFICHLCVWIANIFANESCVYIFFSLSKTAI